MTGKPRRRMKRVLHAIAGIPPNAGGPSRSVPGLCRALSDAGLETWLLSFCPDDALVDPRGVHFLKGPGSCYKAALMTAQRALDSASPDLVHSHGLWTLTNHAIITRARKRGIPVVISARGMLDPWALAQKRWKKRLAMLLYQRRDLHAAALLHATAQQECANIRKQGFGQPVAVIANGVDVPAGLPLARHGAGEPADRLRTALFVARLHPGKGLLDLAEAWARVRPQGWRMQVVGPDTHGHQTEVAARLRNLGIEQDWVFEGAADDTGKWQHYEQADLFILPSHSENFGISIAEALYVGLPVITTKETPWGQLEGGGLRVEGGERRTSNVECRILNGDGSAGLVGGGSPGAHEKSDRAFENGVEGPQPLAGHTQPSTGRCGWWVDVGVEPLTEALRSAICLADRDRHRMGEHGRALVEHKYAWPVIACEMQRSYEWISGSCTLPQCIRVRGR